MDENTIIPLRIILALIMLHLGKERLTQLPITLRHQLTGSTTEVHLPRSTLRAVSQMQTKTH